MSEPGVNTLAELKERGDVELDDEGWERLARAVGEPVGPHGIPRMVTLIAGLHHLGSVSLPLLSPLAYGGLQLTVRWLLAPWLGPLVTRLVARNKPPGWAERRRAVSEAYQRLVPESDFARFHWRQSVAWGGALWILSLATCGIGFVVLAPIHVWFCFKAWRAARAGFWYPLPWIGERLIQRFRTDPPSRSGEG